MLGLKVPFSHHHLHSGTFTGYSWPLLCTSVFLSDLAHLSTCHKVTLGNQFVR